MIPPNAYETEVCEAVNIVAFKRWLRDHGGFLHAHVRFRPDSFGLSAFATETLPSDTSLASCPFRLAITPDVSKLALSNLLNYPVTSNLENWTARQLICSYICLHWIVGETRFLESSPRILAHFPYLSILPSSDRLRTSLYFTPRELESFKGTNLFRATLDREREWREEWNQCRSLIASVNSNWETEFTCTDRERYLTSATYLSSRSFPSTILSTRPSLHWTPSSEPVLIPGLDLFDHSRESRVSWVVSNPAVGIGGQDGACGEDPSRNDRRSTDLSVALVLHCSASGGQEIFNNYGAKPNSELVLGYGFSLPQNADDTIVLKIGGGAGDQGKTWEVGRDARGAECVWEEILGLVSKKAESDRTFEDHLEASEVLVNMTQTLLARIPCGDDNVHMRPEVGLMFKHYVEGQRDILQSMIDFGHAKERSAVETARAQGIELVFEDE